MWDDFTDRFDRLPVWLPGIAKPSLGDVGTIDKRGWTRLYNLKDDFGINFSTTDSVVEPRYEVSSASASVTTMTGSAQTAATLGPIVSAGINFNATFSAEGGFVVNAYGVRGITMSDIGRVEERIAARDANSTFWNRRWVYVTEVVSAEPVIMLVSAAAGASVAVRGSADLPSIEAVSGSAMLDITHKEKMDQAFVSLNRAPFLWRGRWRGRWFSNAMRDLGGGVEPDFPARRGGATADGASGDNRFMPFESSVLYDENPLIP
jgi:hypothetical protein